MNNLKSNSYRRGATYLLLAGLAVLATACAAAGPAQQPASQAPVNSITVSGFGEATGAPDMATIQLGVNVVDQDVGQAITLSNETMDSVTAAVLDLGVAREDVQTTNFNVWPEDRFDPLTGQPTDERVFHVDSTLLIRVREIDQVATVIQEALDAGANNVFGLSFGIRDTAELESEARAAAIRDARARAEQLAAEIGVELGSPILISEGVGGGVIPVPFAAFEAAGIGGGAPPISPGELTTTVQVSVTFAITP